LTAPFVFPNDHSRFVFFRDPTRAPDAPAFEQFRCRAVLLSGLPGAGKDYWLEENLPGWAVVSLDGIRQELGVPPSDPQGEVLNRARELAGEHLRSNRDFVWNATNLSRNIRGECLRLFHENEAHVRIVYVETTPDRLFAQNRHRPRKVPDRVIERLLDRWEVPDRTEAHEVDYVVASGAA
jgi:predicted kinase